MSWRKPRYQKVEMSECALHKIRVNICLPLASHALQKRHPNFLGDVASGVNNSVKAAVSAVSVHLRYFNDRKSWLSFKTAKNYHQISTTEFCRETTGFLWCWQSRRRACPRVAVSSSLLSLLPEGVLSSSTCVARMGLAGWKTWNATRSFILYIMLQISSLRSPWLSIGVRF